MRLRVIQWAQDSINSVETHYVFYTGDFMLKFDDGTRIYD